jgi:primosomal replication protein N''
MDKFEQLTKHLVTITHQCRELDSSVYARELVHFDETLFSCRAGTLTPYAIEARQTLALLKTERDAGTLCSELAEHLSQKLFNQISAISTEITARKRLDDQDILGDSLANLHQELEQHNDWEAQLAEKVKEKKQRLVNASADNRLTAQNALQATRDRLSRCQLSKQAVIHKINQLKGTR